MVDLYEKYNIDKSKLQRDYLKNPLIIQKGKRNCEKPFENDLYYLFIELNLTYKELYTIFGWKSDNIKKWCQIYNIIKTKEMRFEKMKQTNLEKYGSAITFQSEDIKEKIKKTTLKKYGTDYASQSEIIKQKMRQTCLDKYGVEYYTQSESSKELQRQQLKQKISESYICKMRENELKRKCVEDAEDISKILSNKEKFINKLHEQKLYNTKEISNYFHINQTNINRLIRLYNCRDILQKNSSYEKELIKYMEQHSISIECNTRKYLDGQEIDIYIPKLKLGIEFNGNYWHSDKLRSDKQYHQNKSLLAESKGIFIYHIFEYEWNTKKEQIINQLNNLLGINQFKIGARKCIIKEVANKEKNEFLEANHLQGNDSSSIKLGLYYEDKLVSLMTFCKPRFNKKYEWELSRFCSLANYNVIGGASKLFKYFIDNYSPKSIISYSNIAHTKGNLYSNLGFTLMNISDPNYVWYGGNKILTRYQCQKHRLLEQGFKGDSEEEIMKQRNYFRIYDCGNKAWVWLKKTL